MDLNRETGLQISQNQLAEHPINYGLQISQNQLAEHPIN